MTCVLVFITYSYLHYQVCILLREYLHHFAVSSTSIIFHRIDIDNAFVSILHFYVSSMGILASIYHAWLVSTLTLSWKENLTRISNSWHVQFFRVDHRICCYKLIYNSKGKTEEDIISTHHVPSRRYRILRYYYTTKSRCRTTVVESVCLTCVSDLWHVQWGARVRFLSGEGKWFLYARTF